jgi:hypothetical protein
VRLVVDDERDPVERVVDCEKVVLAAGSIETPRRLLASRLGNDWWVAIFTHTAFLSCSQRKDPVNAPTRIQVTVQ